MRSRGAMGAGGERHPEPVPDEIRAHCELVQKAAAALTGRGKLAVCCFGEDPEKLDPKTGKSSRRIPPKIVHFEIGDVDGMARYIIRMAADAHRNIYLSLAVLRPDLP